MGCVRGNCYPAKATLFYRTLRRGDSRGGGSSGGSVLRWSNCDTSWKVLEVPTEMANVGTNSLTLPPAGRPTWTRVPLPATRPRPCPLGWISFSTPNPLVPSSQLRSTTPKVKKCLPSLFMT